MAVAHPLLTSRRQRRISVLNCTVPIMVACIDTWALLNRYKIALIVWRADLRYVRRVL